MANKEASERFAFPKITISLWIKIKEKIHHRIQERYVAAITDKQTKLYPNDLLCDEVGKEIKACPLMIQ